MIHFCSNSEITIEQFIRISIASAGWEHFCTYTRRSPPRRNCCCPWCPDNSPLHWRSCFHQPSTVDEGLQCTASSSEGGLFLKLRNYSGEVWQCVTSRIQFHFMILENFIIVPIITCQSRFHSLQVARIIWNICHWMDTQFNTNDVNTALTCTPLLAYNVFYSLYFLYLSELFGKPPLLVQLKWISGRICTTITFEKTVWFPFSAKN